MPVVKYTDDEGYMWAILAGRDSTEESYEFSPVLGPPDLSPLGLGEDATKELHNKCVEHDLYVAPQLMGRRSFIKQLLIALGIELNVRVILGLFQREYYGE